MSTQSTIISAELLSSLNALVDSAIAGYYTLAFPEEASTVEASSGDEAFVSHTNEPAASPSLDGSGAASIANPGIPNGDIDKVPNASASGTSSTVLFSAAEAAQIFGWSEDDIKILEDLAAIPVDPSSMGRRKLAELGIEVGPEDMDPQFAALFDWKTFAPCIAPTLRNSAAREETAQPAVDGASSPFNATIIAEDQETHRTPRASPAPQQVVPVALEGVDLLNRSTLPRLSSESTTNPIETHPAPRSLPEHWLQYLSLPRQQDFLEAFAAEFLAARAYMPDPDYSAEWQEWEAQYSKTSRTLPSVGKPPRRPLKKKAASKKRTREPEPDDEPADAPGAKRSRGPPPPPPPPPSAAAESGQLVGVNID